MECTRTDENLPNSCEEPFHPPHNSVWLLLRAKAKGVTTHSHNAQMAFPKIIQTAHPQTQRTRRSPMELLTLTSSTTHPKTKLAIVVNNRLPWLLLYKNHIHWLEVLRIKGALINKTFLPCGDNPWHTNVPSKCHLLRKCTVLLLVPPNHEQDDRIPTSLECLYLPTCFKNKNHLRAPNRPNPDQLPETALLHNSTVILTLMHPTEPSGKHSS